MTPRKLIKTKTQYDQALQRLEKIFDAKTNTPQGEELEILSILINEYEKKKVPIQAPDPIEAIKFRMDQQGLSVNDLGNVLGYKSRASEILHRKRKLTLSMIRNLADKLNISPDVLIQSY